MSTVFVAMKHILPSPPQPSFAKNAAVIQSGYSSVAASQGVVQKTQSLSASRSVAPLDAAFLGRVARTTLWFSAVLTIVVGSATSSFLVGGSFAAGALLAVALLKSQEMFVNRLARGKDKMSSGSLWMRLPLALLLPAKYLAIAIGIAFSLRLHVLVPNAFAAGFTVLQVVIFSKVFTRLVLHNLRPLREVYVTGQVGSNHSSHTNNA